MDSTGEFTIELVGENVTKFIKELVPPSKARDYLLKDLATENPTICKIKITKLEENKYQHNYEFVCEDLHYLFNFNSDLQPNKQLNDRFIEELIIEGAVRL